MSRFARLCAALWLACGLAGAAAAQDAAEREALEQAISARRDAIAAFEREEADLFSAIRAADEAAQALRVEARRAGRAARAAEQEASRLEQAARTLEAQVGKTKAALGKRSVALYKAGAVGPLRLVFAPGSLADRLGRIHALQLLLDHDQALLDRFAEETAALSQARADASAALVVRDAARKRLAQRSEELDAERRAKRTLLVDVRRSRARERAVLNELEAAARALDETLADLGRDPAGAGAAFVASKGQMESPVPGGVLRRFGRVVDADYRTETFRKGLDFAVAIGEPVYAIAAGQVRFADWFRGYGRMVILDHGGGYFTVSGHLDTIDVAVGDAVTGGDPIGRAGETGSLSGPRLYFEIREGASAVDPADWLRLLPDL